MYRADIRLVIGTRPEAIKLSPIAAALAERGLRPAIILTGQHAGLDLAEHGLESFPILRLDRSGRPEPHRHVEEVRAATLTALRRRPDLLIVQGDTSSALGAALAAAAAGVPLAHVEAGLRTHDRSQPWPEEEYRCRIDAAADLLFAPTELAAENLRREQVRGVIHVTGNTGIDALMQVEHSLGPTLREPGVFRLLVTCHRRENWGAGLDALAAALIQLAAHPPTHIDLVLHPNARLGHDTVSSFEQTQRIMLHPPCSHRALVRMMRDCSLLLSDSGGMQEEAPALGTPMLVLRDKTERPEAIWSGNMRLVGCRTSDIVGSVANLRDDADALAAMSRPSFPYGDGNAAQRIAAIVEQWAAVDRTQQRTAI